MPFDFAENSAVALRGQRNHLAGASAEASAERVYRAAGYRVLDRRWRGRGGEIDLVLQDAAGSFVFVEVKAAATFDTAIRRITLRQVQRIHAAAAEYLGQYADGALSDTRFDAALVDGTGQVQIMEGALLGY